MQRVLVCDDERHISRLLQVNLERQGYVVEVCTNAIDCLAKLRQEPFDLLVLDEQMPEVLDEIEADPSLSLNVKVLGKNHATGIS